MIRIRIKKGKIRIVKRKPGSCPVCGCTIKTINIYFPSAFSCCKKCGVVYKP